MRRRTSIGRLRTSCALSADCRGSPARVAAARTVRVGESGLQSVGVERRKWRLISPEEVCSDAHLNKAPVPGARRRVLVSLPLTMGCRARSQGCSAVGEVRNARITAVPAFQSTSMGDCCGDVPWFAVSCRRVDRSLSTAHLLTALAGHDGGALTWRRRSRTPMCDLCGPRVPRNLR